VEYSFRAKKKQSHVNEGSFYENRKRHKA